MGGATLAPMASSLLVGGLLLLALYAGPVGLYAYALHRLERPVPAFLAGSALLLALMALAMGLRGWA